MKDSGPYKRDGETVYATETEDAGKVSIDEGEDKYKSVEWLYTQYHVLNNSLQDIAEKTDVSFSTIRRHMEKYGIERRSNSESVQLKKGYPQLRDESWLREQYIDEQKTGKEIADEIGCLHKYVYKWLDKHGIKRRNESKSQNLDKQYTDESWLFTEHHIKGRSIRDIADECDVSPQTIWRWMRKLDIPSKSQCEVNLEYSYDDMKIRRKEGNLPDLVTSDSGLNYSLRPISEKIDKGEWVPYRNEEWLREMYEERGLSDSEIAEKTGYSPTTINRWRKKFGIETREYKGKDHYNSKLDVESVVEIRNRYKNEDVTLNDVAEEYSVSPSLISKIVRGIDWEYVNGPIKGIDYDE